jgi:mannose-1-phosphate guanylyltransferase
MKKDNDAIMMVFPSDHYVEDEKAFVDILKQAVNTVNKKRGLITIGITPTRPETGYGYIQMGEKVINIEGTYKVDRFVEKPNVEVAKDFLLAGNYLWNSGMFVWRADALFTIV